MTSYDPDFDKKREDLAKQLQLQDSGLSDNEAQDKARLLLLKRMADENNKESEEKHSNCWSVVAILSKPIATGYNISTIQSILWALTKEEAIGKGYIDGAKAAKEGNLNLLSVSAMELDFDLLGIKAVNP